MYFIASWMFNHDPERQFEIYETDLPESEFKRRLSISSDQNIANNVGCYFQVVNGRRFVRLRYFKNDGTDDAKPWWFTYHDGDQLMLDAWETWVSPHLYRNIHQAKGDARRMYRDLARRRRALSLHEHSKKRRIQNKQLVPWFRSKRVRFTAPINDIDIVELQYSPDDGETWLPYSEYKGDQHACGTLNLHQFDGNKQ